MTPPEVKFTRDAIEFYLVVKHGSLWAIEAFHWCGEAQLIGRFPTARDAQSRLAVIRMLDKRDVMEAIGVAL